MGGRDSSSKRKSSKRKRDNISSKKKSRRKEQKKRRCSYDSVTSGSDNGSLNSKPSFSPASESDHRRRINKNKKRRRDSSLSSYSDYESVSWDSDSDNANKSRKSRRSHVCLKDTKRRSRKRFTSPNVGKRKRLKKDDVAKPLKKSSKKKSRKYSLSSDSESSSSTADGKRQRIKAIPDKKIERQRGRVSHSGKKKREVSTPSSPSCDGRSHPSVRKYSLSSDSESSSSTADGKRQRSKAIPDKKVERRRGRESHRGKKKREVSTPSSPSCDRGSHPSVSNDDRSPFPTNNSRRLRSVIAVVDQPHGEGENRWEMDPHTEEIVCDQNDYPSPKSVDSNEDVLEVGKSRIDEADQQDKAGYGELEAGQTNDSEKDVSVPDAASGGDLLESILRQKALENLRKFKGRIQTGPKSTTVKLNNESDISAGMAVIVQNKAINEEGSSNVQEMDQRSEGEFSLMKEVKKLPDSDLVVDKDPPDGGALLESSKEDKSISTSDTGPGTGGANEMPSSSVGQHSLEQGNEAKDGSQFEQKTMSVMKGGEIVQVSYKVYIPKKAPALGRRQLMR